jgi:hypothetical protein
MLPSIGSSLRSCRHSIEIEIEGKSFASFGSDFAHFLLDGGRRKNRLINKSRLIHSRRDNVSNVNQALVEYAPRLMVAHLLEARKDGT